VNYSVSRIPSEQARPELQRIWSSSLRGIGNVDERLWWYAQAPARCEDVFVLSADDGALPRIVGTAGLELRAFAMAERELRVGLGCNLAVEAAHRTLLPGLRLLREVRRATSSELDLAYSLPNERAQPLFVRAGYHELGTIPRYVRILRHAPYVRRLVDVRPVAACAGAALDLIGDARHVPRRVRASRSLELVWLDDVDARFDALWERVRHEYPLVARRDASWLRWRYLVLPRSRARIAALVERGPGAKLRAYAVVDQFDGIAHVRDVFGPVDDLDPLLALLVRDLRDRGATSASLSYLGSSDVVGQLEAQDFHRRDTHRRIFVGAGVGLSDAERALALSPGSWYLTEFDEDT